MAAESVFGNLAESIKNSKILLVGAGGVGCEILKNLVLSQAPYIEVIDLDTIDVSNLNRQFLFQKEHVGKSKSEIARETALSFNPNSQIISHHGSIMDTKFDLDYYRKFTLIMNALDNKLARSHVNRMCLAGNLPLIESGTAGYQGQVAVILKGKTECYECVAKTGQKVYPNCTIRNTPSELIHCIVWAKHLFTQLFGEVDPDFEDISPDTADPEAVGSAGTSALQSSDESRKSTREWAVECDYDAKKLFHKLFNDDIKYLLAMENLWKERRPPTPLVWDQLPNEIASSSSSVNPSGSLKDQKLWSVAECGFNFADSCNSLKDRLKKLSSGNYLVWDKDDSHCMDFVTACANIRAYIFGIPQKSKFECKSMAGNIIPAIATTNAIIAGLAVMKAFQVLDNPDTSLGAVFTAMKPNPRKQILVPDMVSQPNPSCLACSSNPEVTLITNTHNMTIRQLTQSVLKDNLSMVAPDVTVEDGKGTVLISSEEGETEENEEKTLSEMGVRSSVRLKCDDFLQEYVVIINIVHKDKLDDNVDFQVVGNLDELKPKEEQPKTEQQNNTTNGDAQEKAPPPVEEVDDCMIIDEEEEEQMNVTPTPPSQRKRKSSTEIEHTPDPKKPKATLTNNAIQEDVVEVID